VEEKEFFLQESAFASQITRGIIAKHEDAHIRDFLPALSVSAIILGMEEIVRKFAVH
jgi:hypothetical protein